MWLNQEYIKHQIISHQFLSRMGILTCFLLVFFDWWLLDAVSPARLLMRFCSANQQSQFKFFILTIVVYSHDIHFTSWCLCYITFLLAQNIQNGGSNYLLCLDFHSILLGFIFCFSLAHPTRKLNLGDKVKIKENKNHCSWTYFFHDDH